MSLLRDIQDEAVQSNSDLGALFRRCKVLAARLDTKPLEDWLIWESNGYPRDVEVPKYRRWSVQLVGHFAGPFGSGMRNAPIPTALVPKAVVNDMIWFPCRSSVGVIQEMLQSHDASFASSTGDLNLLLHNKVYREMECIQAWGTFGRSHLVEVLNTVRNRILDFALAIEKEAPNAGEDGLGRAGVAIERAKVLQIFNTTVLGNVHGVVGSVKDSIVQVQVKQGDVAGLSEFLKQQGVAATDIRALRDALKKDPAPKKPDVIGPRVSSWLGGMVGKAASGAWKVGTDVAATLLSKAIASYYGFGS